MIYILFKEIEECEECSRQININKKLSNNRTWGRVKKITNINHPDYIDGYRAALVSPIFINKLSKWLDGCNLDNAIIQNEDPLWFTEPEIKNKKVLISEDL